MINDFFSKQFLYFLLSGGIAMVVNFLSRIVLNFWLSFSISVITAYIVGMITAFILMRLFVFNKTQKSLSHSAWVFVFVNLFAILQVWVVSMSLNYYVLPWLNITFYAPEIAHLIGLAVPTISSYIGHKYWTFSTN